MATSARAGSAERALGTLIGAGAGLLIILQQSYFHVPSLASYAARLIVIACSAICAYQARLARASGYIAPLSAITIFEPTVVAGHGEDAVAERVVGAAADVLIGIAIAAAVFLRLCPCTPRTVVAASCAGAGTAQLREDASLPSPRMAALDKAELQRAMVPARRLLAGAAAIPDAIRAAEEINVTQSRWKSFLEAIQHGMRVSISLAGMSPSPLHHRHRSACRHLSVLTI
ncbi:hypothetical protein ACU4GD_22825 [Cupriavidus basilensis]